MDSTTHEIQESVPQLASQGKRITNFFVDTMTLVFALITILEICRYQNITVSEDRLIHISLVITLPYFFLMEHFFGQTLGKMVTKTKVVDEYGEPRTLKIVLIRTLCRQIPFEALSFIPNGLGFHDLLSKSRVIEIAN